MSPYDDVLEAMGAILSSVHSVGCSTWLLSNHSNLILSLLEKPRQAQAVSDHDSGNAKLGLASARF